MNTQRTGRGEGWVVAQMILLAAIGVAPQIDPLGRWGGVVGQMSRPLGGVVAFGGAALAALSVLQLGSNLTPFPRPVAGGQLVRTGAYALVRHPIYTGLILLAIGWSLLRGSSLALVLALGLIVFFDQKARREEQWLVDVYPEYKEYRAKVRKLIPWLY